MATLRSRDLVLEGGVLLPSCEQEEDDNELTTALWERLPDVLVEQILNKLPLSSLLRFCCVCKRWRTFILSGYAILFFHGGQLKVRQSNGGDWEAVPLRFLRVGDCSSMSLVASAGGLLCFTTDVIGEVVICNPLTKCYKKLQMPYGGGSRRSQQPFMPYFSKYTRDAGSLLNKAVFVGLVLNSEPGGGFKLIVAGTFRGSLGTTLLYDSLLDSWQKVADVPTSASFFLTRTVTWRGNLYCILRDSSSTYKLLKFNVRTQTWSLGLLPIEAGVYSTLIEYHGNLLLMHLRKTLQYPGPGFAYAYFQLQDSETESPSWLPVNFPSMTNVLDAMSLRIPRISEHAGVPDCLGQGDVICFVRGIDRLGLGLSNFNSFDYKPILRMWIHNISTNTEFVSDTEVEFCRYTCRIFKLSMQRCH